MTQPAPMFPGPAPLPVEAIGKMIAAFTGLQASWDDDAQPSLGMGNGPIAKVVLKLTISRAKGDYDYRQQYDAGTQTLLSSLGGYTLLTIQVRASSLDTRMRPHDVLERVRWGLRTINGHDMLVAAKLAYVDAGTISLYPSRTATKDDRRTIMNGSMDIVLAHVALATDSPSPPENIIETLDPAGDGLVPVVVEQAE